MTLIDIINFCEHQFRKYNANFSKNTQIFDKGHSDDEYDTLVNLLLLQLT